jgi:phenylacetate-CoA ligase
MLIVRGVNVYPSQVGDVLGSVAELSPHFGLEVRREGTLDELTVLVEAAGTTAYEGLAQRVERLLRDTIGCTMAVRIVAPGQAPRSDGGKIQRVTDLRG